MKNLLLPTILICFCRVALATQADDTTITIDRQTAGATPFLSQLTLGVSDTAAIKSIQFTISPKSQSSTRPLSAKYSSGYLAERGDIGTGTIFLPIYGLYDGYPNTVALTYFFNDGSSKQDSTTITTTTFNDPCGYKTPTILQAKTENNSLSYDYILLKGACSTYSPAIIDTDGALRWVGTAGLKFYSLAFFENSIYIANGSLLYRNDLDGTVSLLGNYASAGVTEFHHNVDRGKSGLLFEADTNSYLESIIMEIDSEGKLLKTWNMADIISAAMIAGGENPAAFVFGSPDDWFHSNAVTYNRADDSLIVSSRENFLICLDYTTGAIKWILGDHEKLWYYFPSLQKYALNLAPGSLPPIGQHAVSITYDQDVLVLDNGLNSLFHQPPGAIRTYISPRKSHIDLNTMTATEVWNYPMDGSVYSPYCGSIYEDLPLNYLVDYASVFENQAFHARLSVWMPPVRKFSTTNTQPLDAWRFSTPCHFILKARPSRRSGRSRSTYPPARLSVLGKAFLSAELSSPAAILRRSCCVPSVPPSGTPAFRERWPIQLSPCMMPLVTRLRPTTIGRRVQTPIKSPPTDWRRAIPLKPHYGQRWSRAHIPPW